MKVIYTASFFIPEKLWVMNSERRGHWTSRSTQTDTWRQAAAVEGRKAVGRVQFTDPVYIHVQPYQRKGILADAAAHYPPAKAAIDGLVDAQILKDDSPEFVHQIIFHAPEQTDGAEGLKISIYSASLNDEDL